MQSSSVTLDGQLIYLSSSVLLRPSFARSYTASDIQLSSRNLEKYVRTPLSSFRWRPPRFRFRQLHRPCVCALKLIAPLVRLDRQSRLDSLVARVTPSVATQQRALSCRQTSACASR